MAGSWDIENMFMETRLLKMKGKSLEIWALIGELLINVMCYITRGDTKQSHPLLQHEAPIKLVVFQFLRQTYFMLKYVHCFPGIIIWVPAICGHTTALNWSYIFCFTILWSIMFTLCTVQACQFNNNFRKLSYNIYVYYIPAWKCINDTY